MNRKSGRFGHGYRAGLVKGGREGAILHIQRDLTTGELALLDRDLRLLSGSLARARSLRVYLGSSPPIYHAGCRTQPSGRVQGLFKVRSHIILSGRRSPEATGASEESLFRRGYETLRFAQGDNEKTLRCKYS